MLKHITLNLTRQELTADSRRSHFRAAVADTDLPDAAASHDVARLLIHALSIGGAHELESSGFPYSFPVKF